MNYFLWGSEWFSNRSTSVWGLFSDLSSSNSGSFGLGPSSLKSRNMVLFCASLLFTSSCLLHVTPQASQKLAITQTRKPLKNETIPQVSTAWLEPFVKDPDQCSPRSTQPMKIKTKGTTQMAQSWYRVFQLQNSCHLVWETLVGDSPISTVTFSRIISLYVVFEQSSGHWNTRVSSKESKPTRVQSQPLIKATTILSPGAMFTLIVFLSHTKYNTTSVWSIDLWRHELVNFAGNVIDTNDDSFESREGISYNHHASLKRILQKVKVFQI